jgi:hypothetical protein
LATKQDQIANDVRAIEAYERKAHKAYNPVVKKDNPVFVKTDTPLPNIRKPKLVCTCGKSLTGKQKKYCSQKCTTANRPDQRWMKFCKDCGKAFEGYSGSKYCSFKCANKARVRNNRKCRRCNKILDRTQEKYCSRECLQKPVTYCQRGCGRTLKSEQKSYCSNYCRYNEGRQELQKQSLREMLNIK